MGGLGVGLPAWTRMIRGRGAGHLSANKQLCMQRIPSTRSHQACTLAFQRVKEVSMSKHFYRQGCIYH